MVNFFSDTGDIKFYYLADTADNLAVIDRLGPADIQVTEYTLHRDPTFENSILISLGTDAKAEEGDILPQGEENKNGWFGSILLGFNLGSKDWLLSRSKISEETIALKKQYTLQALSWMVGDQIAENIEVQVVRNGKGRLDTKCLIVRQKKPNVYFKYTDNWEYTLGKKDAF